MATVYLIHLDKKVGKAGHYLGYCASESLEQRFRRHKTGNGACLLRECNRRGIEYHVVRTWECHDWQSARRLEKSFKRKKKSYSKLCPVCNRKGDQNVRS